MTLIIETGGGVRDANAYASESFVASYLTSLNRETDWSAASIAVKEAAIVAATSYIDTRWGQRFKASKLVTFSGISAQAVAAFNANPSADDTITVGNSTYTYTVALGPLSQFEIEIGATLEDTIQSTIDAINSGVPDLTPPNLEASVALFEGSTTSMTFTAALPGISGNDIALSASITGGSGVTDFANGLDFGSQPLEFPRLNLFDSDGRQVIGIPLKLKQAMAEYADRARVELLYQDPTVDATGKAVTGKREKVGPIETETKYEDGGGLSQLLKPYPAADRLLADYVFPAGRVFRG